MDWYLLHSKRCEVVNLVKEGKLKPDARDNYATCHLPYTLPVVSTVGNAIIIRESSYSGKTTVLFQARQSYPYSVQFLYTNDPGEVQRMDALVSTDPASNWKIEENWYRITR